MLAACNPQEQPQSQGPVLGPVTAAPIQWDGESRADVTYQMLLYSFADSNGDLYGDFKGAMQHLDYVKSLGATAIWLSPIHPASSYHGYDVKDYEGVSSRFGSEEDFKALVDAAHKLGIRIYLDFVLNHTSKDHPWFVDAKKSASSQYRDWFIFSDNPSADIRAGKIDMIATEGAGGYDAGQWFTASGSTKYHSHFWTEWFADLNYGPASSCEQSGAFKAVCAAADKWINLGVDGFRLDAVKHIYHNAGSNENPTFLGKFYDHCNATYHAAGHTEDLYMVGEQLSDANSVAPYYKGLPALFDFSFWWTLRDNINAGRGNGFCTAVLANQKKYEGYRKGAIDAIKLSNHDENRTRSELGGSLDKSRLAGAVLLTCGGSPVIYQGEELGYWGVKDSGDEYVRTPIMWTADIKSAATAGVNNKYDRQMLNADFAVETELFFKESILNVYRSFGQARNTYPALATGEMVEHPVYNSKNNMDKEAAVWYRQTQDQKVLVAHNFSDKEITLDFTADNISQPIAVSGSVSIVVKGFLTLAPYSSAAFLQ